MEVARKGLGRWDCVCVRVHKPAILCHSLRIIGSVSNNVSSPQKLDGSVTELLKRKAR